MKFKTEELRPLTILENLPVELIAWLCDHGNKIELAENEHMFSLDQPAHFMFIIVDGKIQRYQEIDGQSFIAATTIRGQVTGMLPFSRMTHYPGNAVAVEPSLVLRIDKKNFDEMLQVSHEFGQRLVGEMSNRVRVDVRLEQQREKLVSLGRLAAGLAHELNNPASAIRRTAASLQERLASQKTFIRTMFTHDKNKNVIDASEQLLRLTDANESPDLSPLQRGECEEEITVWLEKKGLHDSWELASVFTAAGLHVGDLENIAQAVPNALLNDALSWVAGDIEVERMLSEIKLSAGRVSDLILSIKNYSHMDRSSDYKVTHIGDGINDTLKVFGHKLTQKNIKVTLDFEENLPPVYGNAGELNQVWTQLIDNAIDAMTDSGNLCIEARRSDWGIDVKIIDDGIGIPENMLHQIFDPFFTTKGVGEGTGLGLDIARRIVQTHQGQFDVHSKAGRTEMIVRLPLESHVRKI